MKPETSIQKKRMKNAGRRRYSNAFVKHPDHDMIMERYYQMLKDGKVDLVAFHTEYIHPVVPQFKYESFRRYIRNLERDAKAAAQGTIDPTNLTATPVPESAAVTKIKTLVENADASTREGISLALGIGMETLMKIASGEIQLSAKERVDLLFKAMKAQDSRIQATAKVRQDKRDQVAFERVFGEAAYAEENQ